MARTRTAQDDLVRQLVYSIGATWAGPMPPDVRHRLDPQPARLEGVVHSLLVNLEGNGGVEPHVLAPKGDPGFDLLGQDDYTLHYAYPLDGERLAGLPDAAVAFLVAVREAHDETIRQGFPLRAAVGYFIAAVCRAIEAGYELRPLETDEDTGEVLSEGDDIAPGLADAFAAAWAVAS